MSEEAARPDTPANGPLQLVLAVQEHDLALDRLRHRRSHLPERAELAALDQTLARLDAALAKAEGDRAVLAARQSELEGGIEAATTRIGTIERQLYEGRGTAFRDQQAMAGEVTSLQERRRHLEDDELEVMEELEPIDAAIADLRAERETAVAAAERLREAIESAAGVIDGEIAAVGTARAHVSSAVPADLAAEYERLRTKLGGVGAARLVGASCSGCHLTLPATALDRIRHATAGARFHCEQCGRLLVP
jgi:uncharacterized protein